jgi:diadenosine tetraphosphate (Ap4A) HIT family hydrolase
VRGEIPATVVNRTEGFLAIEDAAPKAPVHLLVLPERHLESFRDVGELDAEASGRMLRFVADTATQTGAGDYRLIVNVGPGAGQTVFHLHWHILAGRELPFP